MNVGGTLYGTTAFGGSASNAGTIFSVNIADGTETVLYAFSGEADGGYPTIGLTLVNGSLYGTTSYGGANQTGTIFSIQPSTGSVPQVLFNFGAVNSGDGLTPSGTSMLAIGTTKAVLYGTTMNGGASNDGCVFAFDLANAKESVLYSFPYVSGTHPNGYYPSGGVTQLNGTHPTLYGAAESGGADGAGTVFAFVRATRVETNAYVFPNRAGAPISPLGGLVVVDKILVRRHDRRGHV